MEINRFLKEGLKLELHTNKISLRKLALGIDFVGYIARPYFSVPRQITARRMLRNIEKVQESQKVREVLDSYLGYLSHVRGRGVGEELRISAQRNM